MSRKGEFTAEQVAEALIKTEGFISGAAASLGCTTQTIHNYINKYTSVKAALFETKEKRDDFVESRLLKAIKEDNITAIIFYLKTQAKGRGYVERQELSHDGEMIFRIIHDDAGDGTQNTST